MSEKIEIGGDEDSFTLRIGGLKFLLTESYEITTSFFKQPSAFTVRLGPKLMQGDNFRERVISEILDVARPGSKFEMLAGNGYDVADGSPKFIGIQSGIIDACGSPSADNMSVEIKGRDFLAPVFDAFVLEERSFTERTYYELTRTVLDAVGLTEANGHFL